MTISSPWFEEVPGGAAGPFRRRECAAVVTSDDRTEWRGGLYLSDRDGLWTGMERTYRDVCDLELMRLDITCLPRRDVMPRPNGHPQNGHRS